MKGFVCIGPELPCHHLGSTAKASPSIHTTLDTAKCKWEAIELIGILLLLGERNQANHNIRPQSCFFGLAP